jgi:hypothetical protein
MITLNLSSVDSEAECSWADFQESSSLGQIQPFFVTPMLLMAARNAMVASQSGYAFLGPAVPAPGLQSRYDSTFPQ